MAGDKGNTGGSITTKDGTVMNQGDVEFLITCIQHASDGQLIIDQAGVAAALGMTNVRSAGNKISALKKKYNLPLGASLKAASSDAGPSVPKTTKNDKVKKTPTKKKAVASKAQLKADKVKKQSEEDDEQEKNGEDAAEKDGDETDEKDDGTDEA